MSNQANEAMTILRQLLYVMKVNSARETGNNEDDVFAGSKAMAKKLQAQKELQVQKDSTKQLLTQTASLTKMSKTLDNILKELKNKNMNQSNSGSSGMGLEELLMMQTLTDFGGGKDKNNKTPKGGKASGLRNVLSKLKNIKGGGVAGLAGLLGGGALLSNVGTDDSGAENKKVTQTITNAEKTATEASKQASKQASTISKSADDAAKSASSISGKLKSVGKLGGKLLGPAAALATVGFAAYDYKSAEKAYEESSKTVDDYVDMKKKQDSAIGGAIGATAGAAIGGVAGSIVPGLGTMIGATVGGIVGGYLGDVVGEKFAEDSASQDYYDKKKKDEEAQRLKELSVAEQNKTTVQTTGELKTESSNSGSSTGATPEMPAAGGMPMDSTVLPTITPPGATPASSNNKTQQVSPMSNTDITRVVDSVAKSFNLSPAILASQISKFTNGTNDPTKSINGGFLNTGIRPTGKDTNSLIAALSNELSTIANGDTKPYEIMRRLGWWNSLNGPIFNDLISKGFLSELTSKDASLGSSSLAPALSKSQIISLIPYTDNTTSHIFNDPALLDRLQAFEKSGAISSADQYYESLFGYAKNSASEFNSSKSVPIKPMARGAAVVNEATPSIIGEYGPETVIPLDERGANFMSNMLKDFMPSNNVNVDSEVVIDPLIQYFEDKFMKNLAHIVLAGISNMKVQQPNVVSNNSADNRVVINQTTLANSEPKKINVFGV